MYYTLTLIGLLIVILAQMLISITYNKYKHKKNKQNLTGYDVAKLIIEANNLNVSIEETYGYLSDHYDPRSKTIRLSHEIYANSSIAAASIAAHECGHAIQDNNQNILLKLRSLLIPIVNLSSHLGYIAVMIGLLAGIAKLLIIGILLELIILLFQILTLPIEIDASIKGLKQLKKLNVLNNKELNKGKKVLLAAAFTYIASMLSSLLEIIRLILIYRNSDN